MAVPPYQDIFNAVSGGNFWQRITVAIAKKQNTVLAAAASPMNAAEKEWCNREPAEEAKRIIFLLIGTSPVAAKLDNPGTILDSDIDTALNTLYPNLLKAI